MASATTEFEVSGGGCAPARAVRLSGTPLAPRWRGWVHLGAFLLSGPAAVALVIRKSDVSVIVYAIALVALYGISSAYHLLPLSPSSRSRMRRADHGMIYVFTAASYTPLCVSAVPGLLGTVVLTLVWAGAAVGVSLKVFGFARTQISATILYFLLGWAGAVTLPAAASAMGPVQLALILTMGALYTGGAVVLFTRRPDPLPAVFGYHEVWHASVVLASACYFAVIWGLPAIKPG